MRPGGLLTLALALGCSGPPHLFRRAMDLDGGEEEPAPADAASTVRRDAASARNPAASLPDAMTPLPADADGAAEDAGPEDAGPQDAGAAVAPGPDAEGTAVDGRPELPAAAIPAPWSSEDVGTVGLPGGSGQG
ncbi:MAG TPA: hypothetical protein VN914_13960, partial [Polyangia bacterium]|nr:hypothetical protein [Polyangia bacterium]